MPNEEQAEQGADEMSTFSAWLTAQRERPDMVGDFSRFWESVTPGRISTPTGMKRHLDKVRDSFDGMHDENGLAQVNAAFKGFAVAVESYHREQALENAIETGAVPRPAPDNAGQPDNLVTSVNDSYEQAARLADEAVAEAARTADRLQQAFSSGEPDIHPNHQLPGEFELRTEDGKPGIRRKKVHVAPGESVTVRPGDRIQVSGRQLKPGETVTGAQLPESRFDLMERQFAELAAAQAANGAMLEKIYAVLVDMAGYSAPIDWDALWSGADHSG